MAFSDDKNWDLLQKMLEAEASGKSPRLFSSQRTLFGIPSALDRELAAYANSEHASPQKSGVDSKESTQQITAIPQSAPPSPQRVEHPLDPVFDDESRVLILGTMPSPKSRETGFYYNHPQNRFWRVMARIFNESQPCTNEEKRQLVLRHRIALWDVLASCEIEGAKDVSIAQCVPNDISFITTKAPIRAIFCTGAKATELYNRYCKEQTGIGCVRLPSTSPANAACSLDELVAAYQQIVPFVQD